MSARIFNALNPFFAHGDAATFPFLTLVAISGLTSIVCLIASLVVAIKKGKSGARQAFTLLFIGLIAGVVLFSSPWIILRFFE